MIVELGRLLLRELRLPPALSPRAAPAVNGKLISDRDRVLEAVYQALRGSTDDDAPYLEAAREHLQVRVPDAHQDQAESADAGLFHRARLEYFTSKCVYPPAFPELSSIGFLAGKLRRLVRLAPKVRSRGSRILFISGNPASRASKPRMKQLR